MNDLDAKNKLISELITDSRMLGFYIGLMIGIVATCLAFFAVGKF